MSMFKLYIVNIFIHVTIKIDTSKSGDDETDTNIEESKVKVPETVFAKEEGTTEYWDKLFRLN